MGKIVKTKEQEIEHKIQKKKKLGSSDKGDDRLPRGKASIAKAVFKTTDKFLQIRVCVYLYQDSHKSNY